MRTVSFSFTWAQIAGAAFGALVLAVIFQDTFTMLRATWHMEEYSHGILIPGVSAYLLWTRRAQFAAIPFEGSWTGVGLVVLGLVVYFLGMLAAITTIDAYAFVIVIAGCVLAVMGWKAFRLALVPIALLLLMNPLPPFLYNNLSSHLQLISSQIGVAFIRMLGISVYLEGNVIDLGIYKLEVAEACSGLRYLFPLMSVGAIMAYVIDGKAWLRTVIFLSTIPMTILMNSFRIGVIGVLVDSYGVEQATGFIHLFEGWVVFMLCLLFLSLEAWGLLRLTGDKRRFRDLFAIDSGPQRPAAELAQKRRLAIPAVASLALLTAAVYPALAVPQRAELKPDRSPFVTFPMQMGGWRGHREPIEKLYLEILKLDDYVNANYLQEGKPAVNLYAAYYASQRTGVSAHSPTSCLPGGGWRILSFEKSKIARAQVAGVPLQVNRVVIQQGTSRQLVYYWFQQRGRELTNEYLVKWYLFWDSLTRSRSDGALVRIITQMPQGEPVEAADARMVEFTEQVVSKLSSYVPD
jgi:exosortase D (VPLPA-CTERM-specific)